MSERNGLGVSAQHLSELVSRALAMADALGLESVGIKLDEARVAVARAIDGGDDAPLAEDIAEALAHLGAKPVRASNVSVLHPAISLERLLVEHDELDAQRLALMELAAGPAAPRKAHRMLANFAAQIDGHRAHERRCIYGPLMAIEEEGDLGIGITVRDLVGEIEGDWSAYLRSWNVKRITAEWNAFAIETQRILTKAGERLRIENQLIYPLAFKRGLIPLRETIAS